MRMSADSPEQLSDNVLQLLGLNPDMTPFCKLEILELGNLSFHNGSHSPNGKVIE